jgi:two-component system response regulator HydG
MSLDEWKNDDPQALQTSPRGSAQILIVDDEAENRESLAAALDKHFGPVHLATSGREAIEILRTNPKIKLLLTDLKMPGGIDGLDLLKAARIIRPDVQRLLITAFGTIEDTVKAMKAGAFDVLTKPVKLKALRESVERLLERVPQNLIEKSSESPQSELSESYARVTETLRRAALSEANVLFTGESGSGKSYLARTLHEWSHRSKGPFVSLNCATIPADLLESELFGYEKGAFTGATQKREGKIQAADGGTLLLDEIADMSLALQAKLLQVIQERKFYRLGSSKEVRVNVRILSATNRKLPELVKSGQFREDLYYRLKVIQIDIPSLRSRKQDLFWLVPGILDTLCEKNHLPPVRITEEALRKLWAYDWPGNIRELENSLESALVLAPENEIQTGLLGESSLPDYIRTLGSAAPSQSGPSVPPLADLATLEKRAIRQALLLSEGNRRLAAALLGISERTLYRVLGSETLGNL